MTQQITNYIDTLFDCETLSTDTIQLNPSQINTALQFSSQIKSENKQWQAYLNALGMLAFQEWMRDRADDLTLNLQNSIAHQPQYANIIEAICNLEVGKFKVCLIAVGTASDEVVVVPRAVIDLPQFTAHFYVVVEVIEEIEQATIHNFLRYDQLLEKRRSTNLMPDPDWTYNLPLDWFENNIDDLLLYLRCLSPDAITLPPVTNLTASQVQSIHEIKSLLSSPNSINKELWEILTWEQGEVFLNTPNLINWLYNPPEQKQLSADSLQVVRDSIVNVSLWLRDEMDNFAQRLSWVLLPALAPQAVPLLRSPTEELQAITTQLQRTGQPIPPSARAAYQDFQIAQAQVRLYAVTWSLLSVENIREWSLLLVLGSTPSYNLPDGTSMIISDDTGVLVQRVLDRNSGDTYIYACVVGGWDETFTVAITLTNGASLTLPPFAFRPGS
ncbi:MAG TPA: DUF1822 family protein [Oculatellaceae cyanobacterium]|jgi:hypothetical protein